MLLRVPHRPASWASILVALVLATGCDVPGDGSRQSSPVPAVEGGADAAGTTDSLLVVAPASTGEIVYVPTYSHIYTQDGTREFDLAVTLSIRNTDPEYPITIARVRYFNSEGELVRSYVESPRELNPLASMAVVIQERDRTGGVGANFLVRWQAERVVSEPVIEAVMISTASTQGISFVSRGVVVRPLPSAAGPTPLP